MEAVQTREPPTGFDLTDYARQHRLRTRNLHDGHPVPPARLMPKQRIGERTGYIGESDRLDASALVQAASRTESQGIAGSEHRRSERFGERIMEEET